MCTAPSFTHWTLAGGGQSLPPGRYAPSRSAGAMRINGPCSPWADRSNRTFGQDRHDSPACRDRKRFLLTAPGTKDSPNRLTLPRNGSDRFGRQQNGPDGVTEHPQARNTPVLPAAKTNQRRSGGPGLEAAEMPLKNVHGGRSCQNQSDVAPPDHPSDECESECAHILLPL
jgi:hypothetical protein